ncbi:MAG TPA: nucleoside 2-deoxyribosyltransferase [Candidatus Saccharimonadales bacterium]|nr:nucleoside 2-deoxyribosyltransferase [Candidatus Saccharimonadales bacterium]
MSKPKCYVQSPLGFTELTRDPYEDLLDSISPVVEPINPFFIAGNEYIPRIMEATGDQRQALWCLMAVRLYRVMRDEADMALAILVGEPPDFGVGAELGYGFALHDTGFKDFPVVAYRQDYRRAGETDNNLNGMALPPFMLTGGEFVDSLEAIPEALGRVAATLKQ